MSDLIRILLADDHTIVRNGLRLLIEKEKDLTVIGEAENGIQALEMALRLRPDVCVLDISMPDLNGVEASRQIRAAWPEACLLALTMHSEDDYLLRFVEAGGMGYVHKSAADRDLITAIRRVARGKAFLDPKGMQIMVQHQQGLAERVAQTPLTELSAREREVLTLTVKGYTSREIGDQLSLSPRTVETYRERLMEKLDLKHRSELVEYALRHRLLE